MKKKVVGLLLIGISFFGIQNIHAEEITINKLVQALENSDMTKNFRSNGGTVNITNTTNQISIAYSYANKDFTTVFSYENGILKYENNQEITTQDQSSQATVDAIWIATLAYQIVADLQQYDTSCWNLQDEEFTKKLILDNPNIIIDSKEYLIEDGIGVSRGQVPKLFQMDLTKDVFVTVSKTCTTEKKETVSNNTQTTVQKEVKKVEKNPNTGDSKMIFIVAFLVIGFSGLTLKRIKQL